MPSSPMSLFLRVQIYKFIGEIRFSVQGIGISAQLFLTLNRGNNEATITITPNFNSNTLTLHGKIVPLEESSVYKGRSL